jgi:PKD repeat protein
MPRAVAVLRGVAFVLCFALSSPLLAQGTSTQQNPAATFSTAGPHDVTLTACNPWGCTSVTKTVTVLDPRPSVTSASAPVLVVEAGQAVPLTGSGKGQPPLTYSWRVFLGTDLVQQISGAAAVWQTTGVTPGAYVPVMRITNASGMAESLPLLVTVVPPKPLDFYTLGPCRVLDTRFGSPLGSGTAKILNLEGSCEIPPGARAIAANVTVPAPPVQGNISLYPANYPASGTSTINFKQGVTVANGTVLTLSTDGTTALAALANLAPGGTTVDLVIDVTGYFIEVP